MHISDYLNLKKKSNLGRLSWDDYFMSLAVLTSMRSQDPSTKCGSVVVDNDNIVVSLGYNGFVRGFDDPERWNNKEAKYDRIIHSEANAILNAASNGRSVKGCTLYVTWIPCSKCALMIAQSGIKRVFAIKDSTEDTIWNFDETIKILEDSNIELIQVDFQPITLQRFIRGKLIE